MKIGKLTFKNKEIVFMLEISKLRKRMGFIFIIGVTDLEVTYTKVNIEDLCSAWIPLKLVVAVHPKLLLI